jgi:hypothetical protein
MTRPLLEVLVEDRSTEQALRHLIPLIAPHCSFNIRSFDGKRGLMKRLPGRLRGYAERVRYDPNLRIVVVVDLDDDNCHELKKTLEDMTRSAGLTSLRSVRTAQIPIVATRIAIEELEAWFVGDVGALRTAYPRIPQSLGLAECGSHARVCSPVLAARHNFREPDDVRGGTWEALERLLQSHGYHNGGMRKIALADEVARHMDVENNRSTSFCCLRDGIRRLTNWKVA